jgi:hypothetical protein
MNPPRSAPDPVESDEAARRNGVAVLRRTRASVLLAVVTALVLPVVSLAACGEPPLVFGPGGTGGARGAGGTGASGGAEPADASGDRPANDAAGGGPAADDAPSDATDDAPSDTTDDAPGDAIDDAPSDATPDAAPPCAHSPCVTGVALDPNCLPCVRQVCLQFPNYCTPGHEWDVGAVMAAMQDCAPLCN